VVVKKETRMRRQLAVVAERITRVVRGLWPDRNPLRRTLDRVEGALVGRVAIAFLAGAPFAAAAAWQATYSYGARTAHVQQAAWHRVPAVLLTSVPSTGEGYQATVRARWRAPDGRRRTGPIPAPPVARPGVNYGLPLPAGAVACLRFKLPRAGQPLTPWRGRPWMVTVNRSGRPAPVGSS
jgi:hypothetical protein